MLAKFMRKTTVLTERAWRKMEDVANAGQIVEYAGVDVNHTGDYAEHARDGMDYYSVGGGYAGEIFE
jgi:hypothetical protein